MIVIGADTHKRTHALGAVDAWTAGNLGEWVADWDEQADACGSWSDFGGEDTCFGDATPSRFPGALVRGRKFSGGSASAGPFTVDASFRPSDASITIGFRGAY